MQSAGSTGTVQAGLLRTIAGKEYLVWFLVAVVFYVVRALSRQALPKNVKRLGKSRLRTLFTREMPLRFDLEKYGYIGYKEFCKRQDKPFLIKIYGLDHYVLPIKYLDILKNVDHGRLNFAQSLNDFLNVDASLGDLVTHSTMEIEVVTKFLNPKLTTLTPELVSEADFAFQRELACPAAWTTVNALQICGILTNRTSGRVLFGDLCRDEEYLQAVIKYAEGVFFTGIAFNGVSLGPFRKMVYWLGAIPHRRDLNKAVAHLLPILKERQREASENGEGLKSVDSIQWNLDSNPASPKEATLERHAQRILHLAFAATGTVTILITHMIYNILMYPEYLQPLRDEIKAAIDEHGGWTEKALNDMWRLDSFIKETLRVDPPSVFTAYRTVKKAPFRFSDDFVLPVGARITFPTLPVGMDQEYYDEADKFDGFRFYKKRKEHIEDKKAYNWGATKIEPSYLAFGFGNQACPGRFFGVRKTKILFGKLIHKYDIRWDQPTPIRPRNIVIEGQILVNPEAKIQIKARKD